jgi:hypothetical protein
MQKILIEDLIFERTAWLSSSADFYGSKNQTTYNHLWTCKSGYLDVKTTPERTWIPVRNRSNIYLAAGKSYEGY